MTLTELLASIVIFSLFIAGFSQAAFPVFEAWNRASDEYYATRSLEFVAQSFKKECIKSDRNIETWEKAVSIVPQLDSYEITELWQGNTLRAMKLSGSMGGELVEVIGLCTP
jgi:type II secretory pathway pseudopilin PulG